MAVRYLDDVTPGKYSVYRLVNPFNREYFYIGYTSDVASRFKAHTKRKPEGDSPQRNARWALISSILQSNEVVTMEIVSTFAYRGGAMKFESKLISSTLSKGDRVFNGGVTSLVEFLNYHLASILKSYCRMLRLENGPVCPESIFDVDGKEDCGEPVHP